MEHDFELVCSTLYYVKEYKIYKRLEKIRDPGIHLKEGQEYYLLGGLAIAYGRLKPF